MGDLECPDAIGWVNGHCIVVECKATLSDFRADAKKLARTESYVALGNLRFFLTPKGLLDNQEIPDRWGLYEVVGRSIMFNRGVRNPGSRAFMETGGYPFAQSDYALRKQVHILLWATKNRIGSVGLPALQKPAFEIGEPVFRRLDVEAGVADKDTAPRAVSAILQTNTELQYEVGDYRDADSFFTEDELLHLSDVELDEHGDYKIKEERGNNDT